MNIHLDLLSGAFGQHQTELFDAVVYVLTSPSFNHIVNIFLPTIAVEVGIGSASMVGRRASCVLCGPSTGGASTSYE
jgi:hypothetical protein